MKSNASFWFLFMVGTLSVGDTLHLRVGYIEVPPNLFVENDKSGQPVFRGYAIAFLKWLAADLHFTYELVPINYTDGFTGLGKEFSEKDLHLGLPVYGLKEGRNKLMTPLFPFDFAYNTLIIPYPKRETDPWSFVRPFDFIVWILIFLFLVCLIILFEVLAKQKHRENTSKNTINEAPELTPMYLIGVLTNQGGYCPSNVRPTSRFLAGLWCLVALVLVNAYSGSLITYMTTLKIHPVVNSIEEAIKADDVQLLILENELLRDIIMTSNEDYLKPLAANLARVPADTCGLSYDSKEFELCLGKVKSGDHMIATDTDYGQVIVDNDFKQTRDCAVTVIEHPYFPSYAGFIVPLNIIRKLRNALDVSIQRAMSHGLTQKWLEEYYPAKKNPCIDFRTQPNRIKKLSILNMKTAFIVLAIGYGLSLVAFIYELMRKRLIISKF